MSNKLKLEELSNSHLKIFIRNFFWMLLDWFTRYDTEWFKYNHMPTFI